MSKISVIDYGMGNIHSVAKALYKVCGKEHKVVITNSIKEIESSDKILTPSLLMVTKSSVFSRKNPVTWLSQS